MQRCIVRNRERPIAGTARQPEDLADLAHLRFEIVLSEPHAGRSQADGDALQELLTKGVLPMTVFSTDDLDATFERVRASGAEVLQEPIDQPWGPRDSAFRDPSGNMVRIQQRAKA